MYKVAASYAYKPAAYDLALMYFRGAGVPVNRPLGAAWAMVAAHGDEPPLFVVARDAMLKMLTRAQRQGALRLRDKLRKTYGARARTEAETQWMSAVGKPGVEFKLCMTGHLSRGAALAPGGSLAGAVTDAQLPTSIVRMPKDCDATTPYNHTLLLNRDNPIFHPESIFGTTTVGPLKQLDAGGEHAGAKPVPPSASGTAHTRDLPGVH